MQLETRRKHLGFLASRKARIALGTLIAAFTAQYGFNVPEEMLQVILGLGIAWILGIAHEDNGAKIAGGTPTVGGEEKVTGAGQ